MRKTKLILGLGALLLAGAGAFAAAKTYVPTQVWYINADSQCVDTQLDIQCEPEGNGCVGNDPTKLDSFGRQLHELPGCDSPLQPIIP